MKISQNSISTFSILTINICVHNLKSVMSFLCIVSFSHNEENSLCIEESNAFLVLCFIQGKIQRLITNTTYQTLNIFTYSTSFIYDNTLNEWRILKHSSKQSIYI